MSPGLNRIILWLLMCACQIVFSRNRQLSLLTLQRALWIELSNTWVLFCTHRVDPEKKEPAFHTVTFMPFPEPFLPSAVFVRHSLFLSLYLKILLELSA